MPVHDWTRVDAGIFHHFHVAWIDEIARALNRGLLPADYYALAEQIAGGWEPDVITLKGPKKGESPEAQPPGAVALTAVPPKVHLRAKTEMDLYATKAKAVVVRHTSGHQVIAMVEVVSPGNKSSRHALRSFLEKAISALRGGIHLLIVDLFPPTPRDPQGIHKAIWDELIENDFALPPDRPLTLAAYIGGPLPEAFVEPTAIGPPLSELPLFLTTDSYVPVPLEATYLSAWEAVPSFWRDVLTSP
jgi:Protein of unknown function (DUF4058)